MSNETENENRRRIDKLENRQETNEKVQEANMQVLESNIKEILAENRVAFEKSLSETKIAFEQLRTGMYRVGFAVISAMGVAVAVLGLFLR